MSSDSHSPRPRRVLVVEDNPDCRESLRLLLEVVGFEVQTAEDGGQGVEKALAWRPDAAVVDIGLPQLDGCGVARCIREGLGRRVLLIALSGYAQALDRKRSLEAGFDIHLAKPADVSLLLRLLNAGPTATAREVEDFPLPCPGPSLRSASRAAGCP
jgi:CheY-like chemotaxis protein